MLKSRTGPADPDRGVKLLDVRQWVQAGISSSFYLPLPLARTPSGRWNEGAWCERVEACCLGCSLTSPGAPPRRRRHAIPPRLMKRSTLNMRAIASM